MAFGKGKINVYGCQTCGGKIVTIDLDKGITPFMIGCKATPECDGDMYSSFYNVDQSLEAEYEWYRPKSVEHYPAEHRKMMQDHIDKGGLDMRKIGESAQRTTRPQKSNE